MVFSPLEISGKISACENTVASTMLTGSPVSDPLRVKMCETLDCMKFTEQGERGFRDEFDRFRNGS